MLTLKEISNTSSQNLLMSASLLETNKSSKKVPVAEVIAMLKLEEGDVGD